MLFTEKIKAFFTKKVKSPNYSRFQFYTKIGSILLGSYAFDMMGAQCFYQENRGLTSFYPFLMAFDGLFIGIVTFRLLEVYWWGKDHERHDLYTNYNGVIVNDKGVR